MTQLENEGEVDMLKIVSTMRQDRGGMVQTEQQYVFLHQVCTCLLEFSVSVSIICALLVCVCVVSM